ncbi:MAG: nitronate monooxygenase [Leptolyngbyaceae cyanobacterium MO_188.B28]|nr:nitronate monooxygenase [Leptolyngbyaceae cyanobacterium MO_188.B28]
MTNPLTSLLGIDIPVFQAPIGSVAGAELAAAVSDAGGMGAIALTWTSPAKTTALIADIKQLTTKPFQVNFVLAFEPQSLPHALEAGAPVVTFSWGMPHTQASLVRSFGAKFGVQVSTADGAKQALDLDADFLICQGVEAGGHVQATQRLWQVLPGVVAEAEAVPVVAAGGIATGTHIRHALEGGASGAMLGTRFVATTQSLAHETYKHRLISAASHEAILTVCFDRGWPYAAHRVLRTPTLEAWEAAGCPPSGQRPGEGDIVAHHGDGRPCVRYEDTPPLRGMTGDVHDLCLYAGVGCSEIKDIPSASDLVARLWREAQYAR